MKCKVVNPPGKRILKENNMFLYEIDGNSDSADYCRQLCLISMFFISGKVAYYQVEQFMFYILAIKTSENQNQNQEIIGYYSREKDTSLKLTMSCLFIFPHYMKKGYGTYLIDHSYKMAQRLKMIGSPEKPLSSMGLKAFRKYWCSKITEYINNCRNNSKISIKIMSTELSICEKDIISTLQYLEKIKRIDDNYFILK